MCVCINKSSPKKCIKIVKSIVITFFFQFLLNVSLKYKFMLIYLHFLFQIIARSYNNLSQKQNYNTIITLTIDSYFQDTNRWHNCAIKSWKSLPNTALFTFRNAFVENYFVGLFAQTDSIIFSTANCYTWRASSSANGPRVVCNSHFQTPRNSKPYEKCRRLQTWFAFVQITRQLSIVSTYYYEGFFVRETR